MKANFLKQIARALVFSLFVAGLPVSMQASSPAGTPTTTPATTASTCPAVDFTKLSATTISSTLAPNGCKNFTGATCNITSCLTNSSPNSPTTFDTSALTALSAADYTASPNKINNYFQVATNLANALGGTEASSVSGYLGVIGNYYNLVTAFTSLDSLDLNYLLLDTDPYDASLNPGGYTTGNLPFTTANIPQNVDIYSHGDFASIGSLTNDQKGKLMLGYLQYLYNVQKSPANQNYILASALSVILYTTLAKQMSYWGYYYWAWQAFSNQANDTNGVGAQPACPTPTDVLNFINDSSYVDQNKDGSYKPSSQYQFTNGTIPNNILNLLSAIANAQWSSINTTDLYNVVSSIDATALTNTFMNLKSVGSNQGPNAFVPLILSFMQTLEGSDLYVRCDRYFTSNTQQGYTAGQAVDQGTLFYGVNTASASASLLDQFIADKKAISASAGETNSSSKISLPTGVSDFIANYMTGNFYYLLPSSAPASVTTAASAGVLDIAGLTSLWTTACGNSSSAQLINAQNAVFSQIQSIGGTETSNGKSADGLGSPNYPGNTIQGASQNLLTAAQAAVALAPISPTYSSKYNWVKGSFTQQQDASLAVTGLTTFTPTDLSGFIPSSATDTTSFATDDHINMLTDLINILTSYTICWNNLSYCSNSTIPGSSSNNNSIPDQLKSMLKNPVTYISLALFAVTQHAAGKIWSKLTGAEAKAKAAAAAERESLRQSIIDEVKSQPDASFGGKDPVPSTDSPGGELPPDNGGETPSGPGDGPTTGGNTPPVEESAFDSLNNTISSNMNNIRNLSDADLDALAQKIVALQKQAAADEAAGEADAAQEVKTVEADEAAVRSEAEAEGDTSVTDEFDF